MRARLSVEVVAAVRRRRSYGCARASYPGLGCSGSGAYAGAVVPRVRASHVDKLVPVDARRRLEVGAGTDGVEGSGADTFDLQRPSAPPARLWEEAWREL